MPDGTISACATIIGSLHSAFAIRRHDCLRLWGLLVVFGFFVLHRRRAGNRMRCGRDPVAHPHVGFAAVK